MDFSELEQMELVDEIVDPVEEEYEKWLAKRQGKLTCSMFPLLAKTGRGKNDEFSQTALAYLRRVAAERLGSWYSVDANSMKWGKQNEAAAIDCYRTLTDTDVDASPFRFFEAGRFVGGTPDGIVGDDGCIEVKCPFDPGVHIHTLQTREVPDNYFWQCVGHLLVTGRKWCDFVSFDPRINEMEDRRICVIRLERDQKQIDWLSNRISAALEVVDRIIESTK